MKYYFADIKYKTGDWARVWLSKNTWVYWGGLCGLKKDNPLQYGKILCGLDFKANPVCVRTKDISSISFGEWEKPQQPQPNEGDVCVFSNGAWRKVNNPQMIPAPQLTDKTFSSYIETVFKNVKSARNNLNPLNDESIYDDPLN